MQLCGSLSILWHCLSLGLEWKLTFSSPVATAEFFKFAGVFICCSTLTASSFRTWNSSTGIPSLPLALFLVMLPKAHLTSHCRMSGSRWVIIWLSGSCKSFLYSFSVYSCHLFLVSSDSVRSIQFLSFIEPIFASIWACWNHVFLNIPHLSGTSILFVDFITSLAPCSCFPGDSDLTVCL